MLTIVGFVIFGVAIWKTQLDGSKKLAAFERDPDGIMGTSCRLVVVMDYRNGALARKVLDKAEFQLRYVESLASNWIEESEISVFNAAEPGVFEFSKVNWDVIAAARDAYDRTHGAFDATCRPLIELWKQAGKFGTLPTSEQLTVARQQSSWDQLALDPEHRSVTKNAHSARLDLGGIAKGYAIDVALESMVQLGVEGAMVDVGGDIRVYGTAAGNSGKWRVEIKDPHGDGGLSEFELEGGKSVCTSGDYARYVEIEGERYSHIIDPVRGYPTREVPSVTVIADTAMMADVWATALSVQGKEGLQLLPPDVLAKIVIRSDSSSAKHPETVFESVGFPAALR